MCFNKYKYKCIWYGNKERLTLVYKKIDWSLETNCIDILISSLLFDFNNDVLINSGVDQVRKLVKADKNGVYSFWFYNKVTLPGDASYASLLTNRLSQATIACLMLAYSFSPRVQKYPAGSPIFRSQWQSTLYRMKYGHHIVMTLNTSYRMR